MRSFDNEMELRRKQRERYFENPNFVMWSDIVKYYNDIHYEMVPGQLPPTKVSGLSLIWRWSNGKNFLPPSLLV